MAVDFEDGPGRFPTTRALDDARLWFTCSQGRFSGAELLRLPGSRGQLTLVSTGEGAGPVIWWVFALATELPDLSVEGSGRQIRVLGQTFRL
ncbi:MAG: hypothetical protein GXX96_39205 [Planctomycetaceae bacterium]|nr:hypothetical protein [Planctomycetaceae bacterium]